MDLTLRKKNWSFPSIDQREIFLSDKRICGSMQEKRFQENQIFSLAIARIPSYNQATTMEVLEKND